MIDVFLHVVPLLGDELDTHGPHVLEVTVWLEKWVF